MLAVIALRTSPILSTTILYISIHFSWVKQTVQLENIVHNLLKLLENLWLLFKSSGSEEKIPEKIKIDKFQMNIKKKNKYTHAKKCKVKYLCIFQNTLFCLA